MVWTFFYVAPMTLCKATSPAFPMNLHYSIDVASYTIQAVTQLYPQVGVLCGNLEQVRNLRSIDHIWQFWIELILGLVFLYILYGVKNHQSLWHDHVSKNKWCNYSFVQYDLHLAPSTLCNDTHNNMTLYIFCTLGNNTNKIAHGWQGRPCITSSTGIIYFLGYF